MNKLIIDTDPGIDDAHAIAFAIAHPELELLGLTTVFGNAAIEVTTANALLLLDHFGRPDIPVAKGAATPLERARMPAPDFVHGSDGLGNINLAPSPRTPVDESAAEFIVKLANQHPGQISLVAVGPLTNVALALVIDPDLPSKLKELVIMGGTVDEPGNVTPLAEANFINDPHAADLVLAQDWPATVIGLDVTHRVALSDTHLAKLRDQAGATGKLIWDSSVFYVDFYMSHAKTLSTDNTTSERACAMHDASAVVYLVERDAFTTISGAARVISSGIGIGQLALDKNNGNYVVDYWNNIAPSHVAMQVSSSRVLDTFVNTIINHALT